MEYFYVWYDFGRLYLCSCIPSAICGLIINDTAFCDACLYSKSNENGRLSLSYPVTIVKGGENKMFAPFESLRQRFYYLWRHDLTLYARDAIECTQENIVGLHNVFSPGKNNWKKWY